MFVLRKSIIYFMASMFALSAPLRAADDTKSDNKTLQSLDDIPAYCIQLVHQLDAQPLFEGGGAIAEKSKVLPLDEWDDCRIVDILSKNAQRLLGREHCWPIYSFGGGNNLRWKTKGAFSDHIPRGIDYICDGSLNQPCELDRLQTVFTTTLEKVRRGWKRAELQEYPNVFYQESEDEWILFVKEGKEIIEEDTFVRFLLSKFSLQKKVKCQDYWKRDNISTNPQGAPYLWIKKDSVEEFQKIFGFDLSEKE